MPAEIPQEAVEKYRKVVELRDRATTDGERVAAQGRLNALRERYPGIELVAAAPAPTPAVDLDAILRDAYAAAGMPWPPPTAADVFRTAAAHVGDAIKRGFTAKVNPEPEPESDQEEDDDPAYVYAAEITTVRMRERDGRLTVSASIDAVALKALDRADPSWRDRVLLAVGELVTGELAALYDTD